MSENGITQMSQAQYEASQRAFEAWEQVKRLRVKLDKEQACVEATQHAISAAITVAEGFDADFALEKTRTSAQAGVAEVGTA